MSRFSFRPFILRVGVAATCFLSTVDLSGAVAGEQVLYSFHGGSDGVDPASSLTPDGVGGFWGTTVQGGGGTGCPDSGANGCGTVFRLAANRQEAVIYAFVGATGGSAPNGDVVFDGAGNIYGTAAEGGTEDNGIVFKVAPDGRESQLYAFQGGNDGSGPWGNLIIDGQANLYGMTQQGGGSPNCESVGCGTVFEVTAGGTEIVIHAFQNGADGAQPWGGLLRDSYGNLFGTTRGGGSSSNCESFGCGVIFEIPVGGGETVLYNFHGSDGESPTGTLVVDEAGDLYGTTVNGGAFGFGTVFRLAPDGTETVLYSFRGANDGGNPYSGVIMDQSGNLYGTTFIGGGEGCAGTNGCGTIFEVARKGQERVLATLSKKDGRNPSAGLVLGAHGELYGTAMEGGKNNDGIVFRLKK